jgi:hypothetical protein
LRSRIWPATRDQNRGSSCNPFPNHDPILRRELILRNLQKISERKNPEEEVTKRKIFVKPLMVRRLKKCGQQKKGKSKFVILELIDFCKLVLRNLEIHQKPSKPRAKMIKGARR